MKLEKLRFESKKSCFYFQTYIETFGICFERWFQVFFLSQTSFINNKQKERKRKKRKRKRTNHFHLTPHKLVVNLIKLIAHRSSWQNAVVHVCPKFIAFNNIPIHTLYIFGGRTGPYHIIASSHVSMHLTLFSISCRSTTFQTHAVFGVFVISVSMLLFFYTSQLSRSFWLKFKVHITVSVNMPIASLRCMLWHFYAFSIPFDAIWCFGSFCSTFFPFLFFLEWLGVRQLKYL